MATDDSPSSTPNVTLVAAARTPSFTPSFTPMYAEDYSNKAVGQTDPEWRYSLWTDERAVSGTKCLRLRPNRGDVPPACGGSHFFANNHGMAEPLGLPAAVPVGNTIWFRMYFYFPSTFSFGHIFSAAPGFLDDDADAAACGKSNDAGYTGTKWMNLAANTRRANGDGGKIYQKIPTARRQVAQPTVEQSWYHDVRLESEIGSTPNVATGRPIPLDRWFSYQMAVKVAMDNTGWVRFWEDSDLVAEAVNIATINPNENGVAVPAINSWGLGDYWNGVPYTDGAAGRDDFFVDEIIIASDVAGYGAPTGTDAAGNTYIDPTTRVGDL